MKPRLVKLGVAAAAAVGGFLLQQILSNRTGRKRSSRADKVGRLKEASAKPVEKVEDLSQDGPELLADLSRRVSSRFEDGDERAEKGDTKSLDELAARRREREERRRRRSSAG